MHRTIQHVAETRSKKAFENLMPDEWVLRDLTPDYGIDYLVEIFKNSKSTGKTFYVQLKGTEKKSANDEVKVNVKASSLEYYMIQSSPVLFVVCSIGENRFWGIWINEFLKTKRVKDNQKRLQIKLGKSHILDERFINQIEDEFCLTIPSKVNISYSSDNEIGKEYHSILVRWINHFYPDLFVFEDEHYPIRLSFNYSYTKSYLEIDVEYNVLGAYSLDKIFLNKSSDFLIYPSFDYSNVPKELVETLFLIANLFSEKESSISLELYILLFPDYSGKFKEPLLHWRIGKIALDNNLLVEYQSLIKKCIERENYADAEWLNGAYIMHRPAGPTHEFYGENLMNIISATEDDDFKGMLSYNLANYYLNRGDNRKAIKYYIQAGRLKQWYVDAGFYWWCELGSAFFSERRFKCAEKCYLRTDSMTHEERPLIFSWIGDCLFYQGRFTEAKEWIEKYLKAEKKVKPYVHLTYIVVTTLIDNNLETQERNPKVASLLTEKAYRIGNPTDAVDILEKAVTSNPLCAKAWFKLGILYHKLKMKRESFFAFLVSCIIEKSNTRAWLNALFTSFALSKKERVVSLEVASAILDFFGKRIYDDLKDAAKDSDLLSNSERKSFYRDMVDFFDTLHQSTA